MLANRYSILGMGQIRHLVDSYLEIITNLNRNVFTLQNWYNCYYPHSEMGMG